MTKSAIVVYAEGSSQVRRIIVSDNEPINPQAHLVPGEAHLVFDPTNGTDIFTVAALVEQVTGKNALPKPCAVIDPQTNVVTKVIMADPVLDAVQGALLVDPKEVKVAPGDTYDPQDGKIIPKPEPAPEPVRGIFDVGGSIYISIPKNATGALFTALKDRWGDFTASAMKLEQVAAAKGDVVAMWREPHERMESQWSSISSTPDGFSEWVLNTIAKGIEFDLHTQEQYAFCEYGGKFLPTLVIKWNFPQFQQKFDTGPIGLFGESPSLPLQWSQEARLAFDQRYARDLTVWNS